MNCKLCGFETDPINFPGIEPGWRRCRLCGSDSNHGRIDADYRGYEKSRETFAAIAKSMRYNLDLFQLFRGLRKTFLDVGCCEGTALRRMAELGWDCHGFDVARECDFPSMTVADRFTADRQYDAVMCRETIEHSPDPEGLFHELVKATAPQGLLMVQTPRPIAYNSTIPYQTWHVAIIAPAVMERWGRDLVLLDRLLYAEGQCWTWQKSGST